MELVPTVRQVGKHDASALFLLAACSAGNIIKRKAGIKPAFLLIICDDRYMSRLQIPAPPA